MESEPKSGFAGLILAKVVCCAALVLAATGALGGIGAWFIDSGVIWLAGAFALTAAGMVLWRRRRSRGATPDASPQIRGAGAR